MARGSSADTTDRLINCTKPAVAVTVRKAMPNIINRPIDQQNGGGSPSCKYYRRQRPPIAAKTTPHSSLTIRYRQMGNWPGSTQPGANPTWRTCNGGSARATRYCRPCPKRKATPSKVPNDILYAQSGRPQGSGATRAPRYLTCPSTSLKRESSTTPTASSTSSKSVSATTWAHRGASNNESIPVKSFTSPRDTRR